MTHFIVLTLRITGWILAVGLTITAVVLAFKSLDRWATRVIAKHVAPKSLHARFWQVSVGLFGLLSVGGFFASFILSDSLARSQGLLILLSFAALIFAAMTIFQNLFMNAEEIEKCLKELEK